MHKQSTGAPSGSRNASWALQYYDCLVDQDVMDGYSYDSRNTFTANYVKGCPYK